MFDVRCTRLKFKLRLLQDSQLPTQKNSALRGGMGAVLMSYFCIQKGKCEGCLFRETCVVQSIMNPKLEVELRFNKNANPSAPGFVIECFDYKNTYLADEMLEFDLLIFGKTMNFIPQFIFAFDRLGEKGFGKDRAKYQLKGIYNREGSPIFKDGILIKENILKEKIINYINSRKNSLKGINQIEFITPFRFVKNNKLVDDVGFQDILISIYRRLSILNALEGKIVDELKIENAGNITYKNIYWSEFKRYSSRQNTAMKLGGIKGVICFSKEVEDYKDIIIAGELTHIGKNTSFGLGKYVIKEEGSDILGK